MLVDLMWIVPVAVQTWNKGFSDHSNKQWYFSVVYHKQFIYHWSVYTDISSHSWEEKKNLFDIKTTYLWNNSAAKVKEIEI